MRHLTIGRSALFALIVALAAFAVAQATPGDHTCEDHRYQQTDGSHKSYGDEVGCPELEPVPVPVVPEWEAEIIALEVVATGWGSADNARRLRIFDLIRTRSFENIAARAREKREAEEAEAALLAELASRPKVEVSGAHLTGRWADVNLTLRNNHTESVTAVDVAGSAYDGFDRRLGGECGRAVTWWTLSRANIPPLGKTKRFALDTNCWRGAVRVVFWVRLVRFSDGTLWSP